MTKKTTKKKQEKKKDTKNKSLNNWFGKDEDLGVITTIRKKGTLGGVRLG